MNKSKNIIFLLSLVYFSIILPINIEKLNAFSLKNDKTKTNDISKSSVHKPSYNPGGDEFSEDKEFFDAYQKKHNIIDNNSDIEVSEPLLKGKLIDSIYIEAADNNEIKEVFDRNYFCIENSEIPEELAFFIDNQCVQNIKAKNTKISANNKIIESKNNMNEDDSDISLSNNDEEHLPLIKFKE